MLNGGSANARSTLPAGSAFNPAMQSPSTIVLKESSMSEVSLSGEPNSDNISFLARLVSGRKNLAAPYFNSSHRQRRAQGRSLNLPSQISDFRFEIGDCIHFPRSPARGGVSPRSSAASSPGR